MKRDVKLEYKVLKEKMKEFNKKDAKFYGNMFSKLAKKTAKEAAEPMNIDNNGKAWARSTGSLKPSLLFFYLFYL